jgi:hypothetical protein
VSRTVAALGLVALTIGGGAAHHSFGSYYVEDQSISVRGVIVEFDYRAPHAWVKVKARDEQGEEQVFAAEWANPTRLARDRIDRTTLRIGDEVVVTGSPGRNLVEHRIHLKTIERPGDGWKWVGGYRR